MIAVLYLLLFLYSTKTLVRNYQWSNTQLLVEAALTVNPQNAKVLVAMGNILAQQVIGRDATHLAHVLFTLHYLRILDILIL